MKTIHWMPAALIRIAAVYFVIGVGYGFIMAMREDFLTAPVHAHLNLLGWVSLALTGLIYRNWPATTQSRLMAWHFWLHNTGLPVMMVALFFLLTGHAWANPVIAVSALVTIAGIICFAVNVWRNLGGEPPNSVRV